LPLPNSEAWRDLTVRHGLSEGQQSIAGCVKTLKSQQPGELFSLLPFFRSRPLRYSSSTGENQEGFSTLD
jgi:hypothetical protein